MVGSMAPAPRRVILLAASDFEDMELLDANGQVCHWILEVHLVDTERQIGGFFEETARPGPRSGLGPVHGG